MTAWKVGRATDDCMDSGASYRGLHGKWGELQMTAWTVGRAIEDCMESGASLVVVLKFRRDIGHCMESGASYK